MDIQTLRQQAKELNINSFGKSKEALAEEISSVTESGAASNVAPVTKPSEATKAVAPRRGLETGGQRVSQRAEQIRKERETRGYDIGALDYNLAADGLESGYQYRWVNDLRGRIQKLEARGWERVDGFDPRVVSKRTGDLSYLMRIPQEIYDEDFLAKQKPIDEVEEEIVSGIVKGSESIESNRRAGTATISRGTKKIRASY